MPDNNSSNYDFSWTESDFKQPLDHRDPIVQHLKNNSESDKNWHSSEFGDNPVQVENTPKVRHTEASPGLIWEQASMDALKGSLNYVEKQWEGGVIQAARNDAITRQVLSDPKSYDQIKKLYSDEAIQSVRMQKVDPVTWVVGQNANALPSLIEMGKGALIGAATLGGTGAGMGAVTGGAPGATVLGLAGLAWGGRTGFTIVGAKQSFGQAYDMYRQAGLTHEQSMAPALAAGLVGGALNSVNLMAVGGAAKQAFLKQMLTEGSEAVRTNYVKEFAKAVGINLTAGQVQNAANLTFQAAASAQAKNSNAFPTWQHAADSAAQTALNGVITAPIGVGAAMGAGAAVGKTFGLIASKSAPKDIPEALTNIQMGLRKTIPTSEEEFQKNILQGHIEENVEQEPKTSQDYKNAAEAARSNKEQMQAEALDIKRQVKNFTKEGQDVPERLITEQRNANKAARKANKEYKFAQLSAALGKDVKSMPTAERSFQERQLALKSLEDEYLRLQEEQNKFVGELKADKLTGVERKIAKLQTDNEEVPDKLLAKQAELRGAQATIDAFREALEATQKEFLEIEKRGQREAKADLNEQLDRIDLVKQGKFKVSKFEHDSDTQKVLNLYKHYVENPKAAAEFEQKYQDTPVDQLIEDQKIEYDIASEVGNVKNKTSVQLHDLAGHIQDIIDKGLEGRQAELLAERQATQTVIDHGIKALTTNKDGSHLDLRPTMAEQRANNIVIQWQQRIRSNGWQFLSWDGLLDLLFQNVKNHKEVRQPLSARDAVSEVEAAKLKAYKVLFEELGAATGLKTEQVIKDMVNYKKPLKGVIWKDANGADHKFNGSGEDAIKILMQMNDPSLRAGLEKGNIYTFADSGIPDNMQVQLERATGTKGQQYIQGIVNFYARQWTELATAFKQETGRELGKIENYSGYAQRLGSQGAETQLGEDLTAEFGATAIRKSLISGKPISTIERTENALPLEQRGAFTEALKYIDQTEHWKVWRNYKVLGKFFSNKDVRTAIKLNYGDKVLNGVTWYLSDMVRGEPIRHSMWIDFTNTIMKNAGPVILGLNPDRAVRHMTQVGNYLLEIPAADFVSGWLDFYRNPVGAWKVLKQSADYQNRYAQVEQTVVASLKRDVPEDLGHSKYTEALMTALREGDRITVLSGGWSVYKYTLNKTRDPAAALRAFEDATNRTQFSSAIDQRSTFIRDPNTKVFAPFSQLPLRMQEWNTTAWRDAINHPSAETIGTALRTQMITQLSNSAFELVPTLVKYVAADTEKEKQQYLAEWIVHSINGPQMALFQAVMTNAEFVGVNTAFGTKFQTHDIGIPILDMANHTYGLFKKAGKVIEKGDMTSNDFLDLVTEYSQSILNTGLSWTPKIPEYGAKAVKKILKTDEEQPQ